MVDKYTHYFDTTTRIEENCETVVHLKKQLEASNNLAWKALAEIQNVSEAVNCPDADLEESDREEIIQKMILTLEEVTEQHKNLIGKNISDLKDVSSAIADDLQAVEKMIEETEAFEYRSEFALVGKMVALEFNKPATELEEAEELQELMEKFGSQLLDAA